MKKTILTVAGLTLLLGAAPAVHANYNGQNFVGDWKTDHGSGASCISVRRVADGGARTKFVVKHCREGVTLWKKYGYYNAEKNALVDANGRVILHQHKSEEAARAALAPSEVLYHDEYLGRKPVMPVCAEDCKTEGCSA